MHNAHLLFAGLVFLVLIVVLPPYLITAMRHYTSLSFPVLNFLSGATSGPGKANAQPTPHDIDSQWYPPNQTWINSLSSVINGSGTHGFVYNGSELPAGVEYSTYNWCNMPHVRKEEYIIPGEEYELKYVEVIHRHHKRTPYLHNTFPLEPYPWPPCTTQALFTYGAPLGPPNSTNTSASTYWALTTHPSNPFLAPGFQNSTCQFPQITRGGLDDSWQHGADLSSVYHTLLKFLPSELDPRKVKFRVTNNQITSQVASMLISGLYPSTSSPTTKTPLLIQPSTIDSLKPDYPCPPADQLYALYSVDSNNPNWTAHLSASTPIFSPLDSISNIPPNDTAWHRSLDHYYDNLSARQCHSLPLPCSISTPNNCVSESLAQTIYRLGQYEYSFIYRDSPYSLRAAVSSYGVWIAELAQNIRDVVAGGESEVLYRHNVAHDGSMARLLSVLQVDVMVWPGMGAEVVFEVYRGKTGGKEEKWFVRVLWSGQVLRSSHPKLGEIDMLDVDVLLGYFEDLVGRGAEKVVELCAAS